MGVASPLGFLPAAAFPRVGKPSPLLLTETLRGDARWQNSRLETLEASGSLSESSGGEVSTPRPGDPREEEGEALQGGGRV